MKKMKSFILGGLTAGLLLTGCTWVKVSEDASDITLKTEESVADCKRVGEVNTSTKHKVLGVSRNKKKVQIELDTLARNEAASMGANALVRVSTKEGRSSYLAYRCPTEQRVQE